MTSLETLDSHEDHKFWPMKIKPRACHEKKIRRCDEELYCYSFLTCIKGHGTEGCLALKFKIQSMIESGKIKLKIDPLTNNENIANTSTFVVKGDPSKLAPRHLKRKRATIQED
ncbi:hypothetical protein H5410_063880 [Solanum commersonii]|uniref:Uncharacterized protein n=1 Tax=Solanum commersonii TaxID=4109 RepID=A0A9J5WES1_SOLCO|nr:hypothetical protein H5410_063880 [Solanum commersonii]